MVAMSGGVDSSTAAALLVEPGYDVVGVTLQLYDASGTAASIGGRCCGPRDIEDARATAAHLGIPHYVIDESDAFSAAVIDDFVAEHRAGRTPNPCVRCNERIKFGPLLRFADAVGADALATGHYARLVGRRRGGVALGARARRRQGPVVLPVRRPARGAGAGALSARRQDEGRGARARAPRSACPTPTSPTRRRSASSPTATTSAFVDARGGAGPAGAIVDDATGARARRARRHAPLHRRPAARRPGRDGERRFVLRIDAATGEVRVGPRERLGRDRLRVSDVRWLDPRRREQRRRRAARSRSATTPQAAPAWIEPAGDGATLVRLDEPAFGVAPGQAAVFYDGDDGSSAAAGSRPG